MECLKRLYVYHANKTSNWIIQFSRFDLKKQKNTVYLYIHFALFRLQNQIRKTKKRLLIVFSDFVLNRNIQRTNHRRIEIEDEIVVVFETGARVLLLIVQFRQGGRVAGKAETFAVTS